MKTYNCQDWVDMDACYKLGVIEEMLGRDWRGTIIDVIDHSNVTDIDKIWAITKVFNRRQNVQFALNCLKEIKHLLVNESSKAVIPGLEAWLRGEDIDLDKLSRAARATARAAPALPMPAWAAAWAAWTGLELPRAAGAMARAAWAVGVARQRQLQIARNIALDYKQHL